MINPAHTSGRCPCCGYIHKSVNKKEWRPTQDTFKCMYCDYGNKFRVSKLLGENIVYEQL